MKVSLAAVLTAVILLSASCAPEVGGIIGGNQTKFRFVGASVTAPAGAALPAEQQALTDRLLGGRWSTLGLFWDEFGSEPSGELTLTAGSFESSQAPASADDWSHDAPQPDAVDGTVELDGDDAVWTIHIADAGDGFTEVSLAGRIDASEALDRVTDLARIEFENQSLVTTSDPLPIRWTIRGLYNGLPFTAEVEQDYTVEAYRWMSWI